MQRLWDGRAWRDDVRHAPNPFRAVSDHRPGRPGGDSVIVRAIAYGGLVTAVIGLVAELLNQTRVGSPHATLPGSSIVWILVGVLGLAIALAAKLHARWWPTMLAAGILVSDQAERGASWRWNWWLERLAWSFAFTVPLAIPLGAALVFAYTINDECGPMDIGCPQFLGVFGVPAAFTITFLMAPLFGTKPGPIRLGNRARWLLTGLLFGAWFLFCALVALIPDVG